MMLYALNQSPSYPIEVSHSLGKGSVSGETPRTGSRVICARRRAPEAPPAAALTPVKTRRADAAKLAGNGALGPPF